MQAGPMRQRISLQALIETPDTFGQLVQSWTTLADTWAEILTIGGGEQVSADQTTALSTHTVRLRKNPDVTLGPTMRVLYGGRVFEVIQAKDVDFRHREARLLCRELVGVTP